MRRRADRARVEAFLRAIGERASAEAAVYLAGGATAVLMGWRESTIDVDLRLEPDDDRVLRLLPGLKEELQINVELASPGDFIPDPPGWRDRSIFIAQHGSLSFYHYDLYGQALSKVERAHTQDRHDVAEMLSRGLIEGRRALELFDQVEPELYRYPAIDPASFRAKVEATFSAR
ncbi:MAG: DUF6036 family nucleotidyltransferase [Candidatus Limnocylindria bacterium]